MDIFNSPTIEAPKVEVDMLRFHCTEGKTHDRIRAVSAPRDTIDFEDFDVEIDLDLKDNKL